MIKRNKKRGQVSAFIIFAIFIVGIIVILFIYFKPNLETEKVNPDALPIYNYVNDCLKETGEKAVFYIGQTGGYFIKPNLSTDNNIAYYYDKGENHMPSKESIERELSLYMDNMLFFCVEGFNNFPDFNVSQKEIITKAKINEGKVKFDVTYPISVSKGGKTYSFEKFSTEVPVRLDVIYNVLGKIMQEQMVNPDICITCLDDIATENDMYIDMYNPDEETVIFIIKDDNSKIKSESYKFIFANRY